MLLSRAGMVDSFSSLGIDLPSPMLSARLRELADFLAAPTIGRLTEEQRALSLGIARRLVVDVARELDGDIDMAALWSDWLTAGLPTAARLAGACFARAEEHRWRSHSAQQAAPTIPAAPERPAAGGQEIAPEVDRAYLMLQIADRRRVDDGGHPRIALADTDSELLDALLRDIAMWRTTRVGADGAPAINPDHLVADFLDRQGAVAGMDEAAAAYRDALGGPAAVADAAETAIARHDWAALIALAAAESRRSYADTALSLLSAEPAALPALLAPLRLDRAAIAPLEASLAALPARAGDECR